MKYRYIVIDEDGNVTGTNDRDLATYLDGDNEVLDATTSTWLGSNVQIEEAEGALEADEPDEDEESDEG